MTDIKYYAKIEDGFVVGLESAQSSSKHSVTGGVEISLAEWPHYHVAIVADIPLIDVPKDIHHDLLDYIHDAIKVNELLHEYDKLKGMQE